MKKIFSILTLLLLISITACDDGEMTVKSFNFTGSVSKCTTEDNVYVKTSGSEVLIMNLDASPLLNIAGTRTVSLATGTIKYRNYSSNVTPGIVCSTIDSPDAYVLEEWQGSGTIEIITTKLDVPDTGVIKYSHTITFLDVSLTKGDETIRIQNTDFGIVETQLNFEFEFASGDEVNPTQLSECTDFLYDTSGSEALLLYFAADTFGNVVDEAIVNLDDTANFLTLKVYSSSVGSSTVCSNSPPLTPTEEERWEAVSGRVKIVKTVDGTVVHYDIYLYNDVVFYNVTAAATATEFFIPEPTGSDAEGDYYYLGQYTP